jgi:hypothetical protein
MRLLANIAALALVALFITGPAFADSYRITVYTADTKKAGTDATVKIRLKGTRHLSRVMILDPPGNSFERAQWDTQILAIRDLGQLTETVLSHDGGGKGSGWLPQTVYVTNLTTGDRADFGVSRWIYSRVYTDFGVSSRHKYKKSELERERKKAAAAMKRQKKRK